MRQFAEILTGTNIVRCVFDWDLTQDPEFNPDILFTVDITNLSPQPQEGWTYQNGVFSPPA